MRFRVVFALGLLALTCSSLHAWADKPICFVRVEGDKTDRIYEFRDTPDGLLLRALNGLFRYDGTRTIHVEGAPTGTVWQFHDTPGGLLIGARNGLFLYDGTRTIHVEGDPTGEVNQFYETQRVLLLGAWNGLFRYDGKRTIRVEGDETGRISVFHDTPGGLLIGARNGLFRYDGTRTIRVKGDQTGEVYQFHNAFGELLLGAFNGLFRYDSTRVVLVPGVDIGPLWGAQFHDTPGGLLIGARSGLFRYDGTRTIKVEDPTGEILNFHDTPGGLLIGALNGLFRYAGTRAIHVEGNPTGPVWQYHDTPGGLLIGALNGLFRYDGTHIISVESEPPDPWRESVSVWQFHEVPDGLLIGALSGLFRYDGTHIISVESDMPSLFSYSSSPGPGEHDGLRQFEFHDMPGGLLIGTNKGLFRGIYRPPSTANLVLENASQLKDATTSQEVRTRWTLHHPCAATWGNLYVIASSATDAKRATNFEERGDGISFEAEVPVPEPGNWTFRLVSINGHTQTNIGQPSETIHFVAPGSSAWWAIWWKFIAAGSAVFVAALNLLVFFAARYSSAAWRLATDELWGKKALFLQSLMLRHWRVAQLWLLDLYVRERRKASAYTAPPYLPLPLTGPKRKIADSDGVLARLAEARHLWVQGGTGMGKTALFWHLRQTHFGGAGNTAFSIFRGHNYVLVPVEARRFPEAPFEEKGGSAWVVACVLSILSEGGLSFEDRGLLRAMLRKGTLGVAIDGLNEVARGQAVAAFAAEFPVAPLFVTSQETGEAPFEVWRLPGAISEHVDGLLALYLGEERGKILARRLRQSGLTAHLRSGYDVRLVIDLAEADPEGTNLPHDRIGLYRAAVAAAWPEGDERLDKLEAAAWKLMSERGPHEDKRRLKPDEDAPKDLLERLEAVRERSGCSIRLIRAAPPYYEFVHDQMNAYLAACWLASRATVGALKAELAATKVWQDGAEAQRTLWGFVAVLLEERASVEALWIFAGDDDRCAVLQRTLAERAEREGWTLTRPAVKAPDTAERQNTLQHTDTN